MLRVSGIVFQSSLFLVVFIKFKTFIKFQKCVPQGMRRMLELQHVVMRRHLKRGKSTAANDVIQSPQGRERVTFITLAERLLVFCSDCRRTVLFCFTVEWDRFLALNGF